MSIWDKPEQHTITKTTTRSDGHLRICRCFEIHLRPLTRTPGEKPPDCEHTVCPKHPSGTSVSLLLELWMVVPGQPRCKAPFLGCQALNKYGLPPTKLGRFGKAGPVFFMATVGWAECLWATLVGLSCSVCHGSPPFFHASTNFTIYYPISSALFLEQR